MNKINIFSLIVFGAFFAFTSKAQTNEIKEVSPTHAQAMVNNGAIFIDVREAKEIEELAYDAENFINIPLREIHDRIDEIPKDKALVLACRSGQRSLSAAKILQKNGYSNLVNLEGGILAWQAQDLAVIKSGQTANKACCSKGDKKACSSKASCKSGKTTKKCGSKNKGAKCCSKKSSKKSCSKSKAGSK